MSSTERRRGVSAGVLILAIGLSVRFPITSVSPLLADIGTAYGLSASGLAALSSLPVLMFGLASPFAPLLVRRFGLSRAVTLLLALLALATLVRPLATPLLFAGVILGGAAIALLGILAPQIIRQGLAHRGGFWTGVYTTSFGVSAAVGAAFSVPLLHMLGESVSAALMAWAVPLLIALGLALGFGPGLAAPAGSEQLAAPVPRTSVFRAPGIWAVTGFFGCQALIYFALTAWLPTIALDRGLSPSAAGLLLAWLSIAGLPASLVAPTLASKPRLRTPLIVGVALLSAASLLGLAYGPIEFAPLVVALLGIAQSGAFGLAIALIVFTAPSASQTAAFSAVSQGVGYAFAAAGPLVLGLLSQAKIEWSAILLLLVGIAGVELVFGVAGSRASQRGTGHSPAAVTTAGE
ncbi:CP family cyanate transporter-like MFS transporter [Leucobacter luti]|uniref:MFS transporter n=1 Tax=Leucobacter luti TaxID=340320 RepID=UPI0010D56340|nr:MFS transporter [Leucobacter luti]MCW2289409.1 CP family cyanate transporter-like MFS transporter [Leucobacter luti]TCK39968.1 CP family cyanate transporter-like MFS transporter [Leucobacter luti]